MVFIQNDGSGSGNDGGGDENDGSGNVYTDKKRGEYDLLPPQMKITCAVTTVPIRQNIRVHLLV